MRTPIALLWRSGFILFMMFDPAAAAAQQPSAAPAPRTWTIQELFQRNIGSPEQQRSIFPPHKVADNIWYVGTESLASFLVTTPQGHILIRAELDIVEGVFNQTLDDQRKGAVKQP